MTEIESKGEIMACIRKFVGLGLTLFADVQGRADTLCLEVSWETIPSIMALGGVSLIVSQCPDQK